MNILIVGCGRVGMRLVQTMETLGHDVAVVDENPKFLARLEELTPPFTGIAIRGVPIDVDVLRSAGIEACDAVAAVTQDDNMNVMVAQMAREVFDIRNVIARVTDPSSKEVFSERFGLRAVCGTNLTAQAIVSELLHGAEEEEERHMSFGSSTANFVALDATAHQVGRALCEMIPPAAGMMLFGVWRASGVMELAVDPGIVVRQGDKIVYTEIAD